MLPEDEDAPLPEDEVLLPLLEDEEPLLPEDDEPVLPPLPEDDDAPPPDEEPPDEEAVLASLTNPASPAFVAASPTPGAKPSLADPESIASGSPSGAVSWPLVESRPAPPPSSPGRSEMPRMVPHPAVAHAASVAAHAAHRARINAPPRVRTSARPAGSLGAVCWRVLHAA